MEVKGEFLCLARTNPAEVAAAKLIKRVLNARQSEAGSTLLLREILKDWLAPSNDSPTLPLIAGDVKTCVEIIESQVEITEEAPRGDDPKGTASPHDVSTSKDLLPEMREFAETGSLGAPGQSAYNGGNGSGDNQPQGSGRQASRQV